MLLCQWRRRAEAPGGGEDGLCAEPLRIIHRPEAITERQLPSHWEGDLSEGAYNRSAVGTLVDRKTRFVVLCRMACCTVSDTGGLHSTDEDATGLLAQNLTYERGGEMGRQADGAVAAQQQGDHQWSAAPVLAQGHGSCRR